jgi:Cu/Ag efflux protein CusF
MKGSIMKTHQSLLATVTLILASHTGMVLAEPVPQDHATMLKAINLKDGKVQISHEAIASLNWPPMTMWFTLYTPLPKDMKAGDQVRFELEQNQNKWGISKLERR